MFDIYFLLFNTLSSYKEIKIQVINYQNMSGSLAIIKSDIIKLQNIQTELKRLSAEMKKLRKEKERLESKLIQFLEKNENSGITIDDTTLLTESKKRRERKGRTDKEIAALEVLRMAGVSNADSTLEKLLSSMKGNEHLVKTVKIQRKKRN